MLLKQTRYEAPEDDKGAGGGAGAGDGAGGAGEAGKGASGEGGAAGKGAAAGAGDKGAGAGDGSDPWGDLRAKVTTRDGKVDEKIAARIARYATPVDAVNALLAVQSKIGAGELRSNLPKNATAEQITAWRAENGIPETPAQYDLGDVKVASEDKPMVDSFLAKLHTANAPAGVAKEAVKWYQDETAKRTDARLARDKEIASASEDKLRAEWGNEYRQNINMVNGLLETVPADVRELFKGGRLADGTPIMSAPGVLKALVAWSRQINPVTTIVPNAGANIGNAIEDEIKTIEKTMRTDRKAYNEDDKMQARYRELLDARARIK